MILAKLDKLPPCLCRLVARKANGHRPLSTSDIAGKANLSKGYVAALSLKTSWSGVSIDIIDRFSRACGADPLHPGPALVYLKFSRMQILKNASSVQRTFLLKLFRIAGKRK